MMYGSLCCENRGDIEFLSELPSIDKCLEVSHNLSIDQRADEVVAGEILYMPITFILLYQLIEPVTRYKLDDLGEHELSLIHNLDASEQQD